NILIAGAGTWKLADFGVAHIPDSSLTMTGQFVGSPAYAPPEALVRGQSDAEGDVYGLGATLYQAAAGSWPRLGDTIGAQLAPALPAELAALIDRAVAVDPRERPSASELADVLAGAVASPAASAGPNLDPGLDANRRPRAASPVMIGVPLAAPVQPGSSSS